MYKVGDSVKIISDCSQYRNDFVGEVHKIERVDGDKYYLEGINVNLRFGGRLFFGEIELELINDDYIGTVISSKQVGRIKNYDGKLFYINNKRQYLGAFAYGEDIPDNINLTIVDEVSNYFVLLANRKYYLADKDDILNNIKTITKNKYDGFNIKVKGNKVIVTDDRGYRGTARCFPDDEFNITTGIDLAVSRLKPSKCQNDKPKKKQNKTFIPKLGERFFYLDVDGEIEHREYEDDYYDLVSNLAVGNIFETEEKAKRYRDKVVAKLAKKLNIDIPEYSN